MSTAFESLARTLQALLQQEPPVAQVVLRNQRRPLPQDTRSAVIVRTRAATGQPFAVLGGPVDWTTRFELEIQARDTSAADVDDAADAVLAAVYERLAADSTLGGRVIDLRPEALEYDLAAEADNLACITLAVFADHRTHNASLE